MDSQALLVILGVPAAVLLVTVVMAIAITAFQCNELWKAWVRLGSWEALNENEPQNLPKSGLARTAYLEGWEAVVRERSREAADQALPAKTRGDIG